MSKCPLLIATPNHWVVDCYGEECAWFHSVCKQPQKAKTNADRIRAMTDEEIARVFTSDLCELLCHSPCTCDSECESHMLDWLKQEVKE